MKHILFLAVLFIIPACIKTVEYNPVGPPEANYQHETIRWTTPPNGFPYILPWAQAVHDNRKGTKTSTVEVDYFEVWAVVAEKNIFVRDNQYNSYDSESKWFGLYARNPWFSNQAVPVQMPVEYTAEGYLRFHPSTVTDKVWHWWITGNPKAALPTGTQRIWIRICFRITGPALVQIGADFYQSAVNDPQPGTITEYGASDWYSESLNWQTVILGKPGA
jgi:hypothetical protein